MDLGTDIIRLVKVPVGAGVAFVLFNRIGAWLDREIDTESKETLRNYLKGRSWIYHYSNFLELLSSLYDRVYGAKTLGWKPLLRAFQLTIFPFAFFVVFWVFSRTPVWLLISWETVVFGLLPRFFMNVVADFVNIAGTRWSLRWIRKKRSLLTQIAIAVLDVTRVIIVAILLNLIALDMFRILYTGYLSASIENIGDSYLSLSNPYQRKFLIEYTRQLLMLHEKEAVLIFSSLLPSFLLCLFIVVSWLKHIGSYVSNPIDYLLDHLEYSSPFTLVFSIGGCAMAGMYVVIIALLAGIQNYVL